MVENDILCFTETHLDGSIHSGEIFNNSEFTVHRKDRNLFGGGVLIAIRNDIAHRRIVIDTETEVIAIELTELKLGLCCVYRSPSSVDKNFMNFLDYYSGNSIILGDFNLPGINWLSDPPNPKHSCVQANIHKEFIIDILSYGYSQLIQQPTHVKGNILDLVLTNKHDLIHNLTIHPNTYSDHNIISFSLLTLVKRKHKEIRHILLYKKCDLVKFEQLLTSILNRLKEASNTCVNINEMWDLFEEDFIQAVKETVPIKKVNNSKHPWLTTRITRMSRSLKSLWHKYKSTGDEFFIKKYKNKQRVYKNLLRKTKNDYLSSKIFKPLEQGNSKPFFKHLNSMKTPVTTICSLTKPDGELTEDKYEISNILNDFFQSQFCTKQQLSPNKMLRNWSSDITANGVCKLIGDLKHGKAPGPDGINASMLQLHPELTAECLSIIYNKSFSLGQVPARWKEANVVPLHKTGDRKFPGNYRPVSLTSIPCKIMEHIILHKLNEELEHLLTDSQHGFRQGLSCETQLTSTIHSIAKNSDQGYATHALILDFKKAFDKVPHRLLMEKLEKLSVSQPLIDWIASFLTSRSQKVTLSGISSQSRGVSSGVPQGSVLGPRLFLTYINDLPESVNCSTSLFADDTIMYSAITSGFTTDDFQNNIDKLLAWSHKWLLEFNIDKCKIMIFTPGKLESLPIYFLDNSQLQIETQSLYLGVWLSFALSWRTHIETKARKASQMLGFLKRNLYNASQKVKLIAYKSLVRSVLEYGSQVWDPYKRLEIDLLESIQRKAVRFICNIKGRQESITPLLEELGLEPLHIRRKNSRIALLHKIIVDSSSETPGAISAKFPELMNSNENVTDIITRSRSANHPSNVAAKKNAYHHSFLPRTIRDLKLK
jgi:hypothetical protein